MSFALFRRLWDFYHILSNQAEHPQKRKYCLLLQIVMLIHIASSDEAGASAFRRIISASSLRSRGVLKWKYNFFHKINKRNLIGKKFTVNLK